MKKYIKLYNVIDTRTNEFHSVAVASEKNLRYFVPMVENEE